MITFEKSEPARPATPAAIPITELAKATLVKPVKGARRIPIAPVAIVTPPITVSATPKSLITSSRSFANLTILFNILSILLLYSEIVLD